MGIFTTAGVMITAAIALAAFTQRDVRSSGPFEIGQPVPSLFLPDSADGRSRSLGAHGIVDDWASASSLQLWANTNRLWFAVAGAATAACAALLTRK